ncbi:MAG: PEGA domain-containing protein [Acidobacteria bacterium]|nr:PEGA domain-containing protein [Acidobacteriota bacterium]
MKRALACALCLFLGWTAVGTLVSLAGEPSAHPPPQDGKRRVFITDSQSWSMSGGFGGSSGAFGGAVKGGARPQTAEIIKTFTNKCKGVTVTMNQQMADFVVLLDHEGGKGFARKDNKIAVFDKIGDAILSKSTRSLGNAVDDACKAIMKSPVLAYDPPAAPQPAAAPAASAPPPMAPARAAAPANPSPPAQPAAQPLAQALSLAGEPRTSEVMVKSEPSGADIMVDGKFVGNTPSSLRLAPGDHTITVEKSGFKTWERTMTVTPGGNVTLKATLESR